MAFKITEEVFPVRYDLPPMTHKADWHWAFQMFDDDGVTPQNTTGYTCTMYFRQSVNGEVYATLTIGSGITMTAGSGLFNVDLDKIVIDMYDFQEAEYLVIVTTNTNDDMPMFFGKVRFAA